MLKLMTFLLVPLVPAAPADECPHQTLRTVAIDIQIAPFGASKCTGGFEVSYGGLVFHGPAGSCPKFVVITPAHDEPQTKAGANTYVRAAGAVDIERLDFECTLSFPIFGSWYCKTVSSKILGQRLNYEVRPCAELPRVADPAHE